MMDETPDTDPNAEKEQETISDIRVNPDHVFGSVAEKIEYVKKGEWVYRIEDALYRDVLNAAHLEGFRVINIEHVKDNVIDITIKEEKTPELKHEEINT